MLRSAPDSDGVWGVAALHRLVARIRTTAKAIKPDALVITHTVHPSFGDVTDMVRTNDVLEHDVTGRPVSVAAQLRARFEIVAGVLPGYPVDTDQWPMPNRAEWLDYAETQAGLGVPALYYLEHVARRMSRSTSSTSRSSVAPGTSTGRDWNERDGGRARRVAHRRHVPRVPHRRPRLTGRGARCRRHRLRIGSGALAPRRARHPSHHRRLHDASPPRSGAGPASAVAHGARIHVPPVERELFDRVEEMWEGRQLDNDYNLRQDRFSLLESVPVHAGVPEYRTISAAGVALFVLPTPGHTIGSVSYLLDRDGERLAFTGDLIHSPGKVWSLAATQWSYTQTEGPAMTVLSALLLHRYHLSAIAPSHGDVMREPDHALELLAQTMQEYVDSRRSYPWDLRARLEDPFIALTPHLLLNRTSISCSYVVLSETGEALIIDYGYDMTTGLVLGQERAHAGRGSPRCRRCGELYGVTRISVALPTHYHDDHIAGMPLLREVEGTQLWIPENVAPTMADPWLEDLPCQWYDPIVADRVLPLGEAFTWNEYTITAHEQPGHTLYAVAYEMRIDGVNVAFTGDQQEGLGGRDGRRDIMNYQYRNLFRLGDYVQSAALYRRIAPGLMAGGHWDPRWADEEYLHYLEQSGRFVDELHERLLPEDALAIGPAGQTARLLPYRRRDVAGESADYTVQVRNPFAGRRGPGHARPPARLAHIRAKSEIDPRTRRGVLCAVDRDPRVSRAQAADRSRRHDRRPAARAARRSDPRRVAGPVVGEGIVVSEKAPTGRDGDAGVVTERRAPFSARRSARSPRPQGCRGPPPRGRCRATGTRPPRCESGCTRSRRNSATWSSHGPQPQAAHQQIGRRPRLGPAQRVLRRARLGRRRRGGRHGSTLEMVDLRGDGPMNSKRPRYSWPPACRASSRPRSRGARQLPRPHHVPLIEVDRRFDAEESDAVVVDNRAAARNTTIRLLTAGHERIALLIDETEWTTGEERHRGISTPGAPRGREDKSLIVKPGWDADEAKATAERIFSAPIGRLRCSPPTTCSPREPGAPRRRWASESRKISVWRDSTSPVDEHGEPGVSTRCQDASTLGATAMRALLERIETPDAPVRTIVMPTRFIDRGSIAPPPR